MKRILLLACSLFFATSLSAQRIAVLEFKAGTGVSQAEVDGISEVFNTFFRPTGYTMVERTMVSNIVGEWGFQKDRISERKRVRFGKLLNVSKIVIGRVNIVAGQYLIDTRVVNVQTGVIAATSGGRFSVNGDYRNIMEKIATELADQIAIKPQIITEANSSNIVDMRTEVETVLGYLKVYPKELGFFTKKPTDVIEQINRQHLYDYDTWRLPTTEELSLLRANNYLSDGSYMVKSVANTQGIVLLVTDAQETYTQRQEREARDKAIANEQALLAAKKVEEKKAEAERIAKEKAIHRANIREQCKAQRKGFGSIVDVGIQCAENANAFFGLSYIAGYRFNNSLFLGAGIGANFYYSDTDATDLSDYYAIDDSHDCGINHAYKYCDDSHPSHPDIYQCPVSMPLYGYFRANFNGRCSPFLALAIGGNISGNQELILPSNAVIKCNTSNMFINPQIGINIRFVPKVSVYFAIGYYGCTGKYVASYTTDNAVLKHRFLSGIDFHIGFTF